MLGLLKKEEEEEERRRMPITIFLTLRGAYVNCAIIYSNVIHLFDWKSAIEHDGGV